MEEVMMMISSPENSRNELTISAEPITASSTCLSWKLYENPFYYPQHHPQPQQQHQQCQTNKHFHHLHLSRSTRKIAASFWDLTFFTPIMESELEFSRAQITELKAELEYERKARKKAESMNRRLARELTEERRGREAMESVCEELAKEISSVKAEINRMKREMEEERKMLRMAEVLREERVQMKLTDAKILFEEKLQELEESARMQLESSPSMVKKTNQQDIPPGTITASNAVASFSGKFKQLVLGEKSAFNDNSEIDSRESARLVLSEKSACYDNNAFHSREFTRMVLGEKSFNNNSSGVSVTTIQRKASPEPENPHIKRGIKGFVEFPRVVRAMGSKSRHWGTKLECQKAQLRILLKQRSPIRSGSFILS